jgi:hypothetical protein
MNLLKDRFRFYLIGTIRRLVLLVTCLATVLALAAPAFAMLPQFFDQLNLKNNRHSVAAGGPCHWEAGDAWPRSGTSAVRRRAVALATLDIGDGAGSLFPPAG